MVEAVTEEDAETSADRCSREWTQVVGQLREEIGEAAYRSWLQPLSMERVDGGQALVVAPTPFLRDWVAAHYADRLLAFWRAENRQVLRVSIIVARDGRLNGSHAPAISGDDGEILRSPVSSFPDVAGSLDIGEDKAQFSALDPRFSFENFVVGTPNQFAHAVARRVAEACAAPDHTVPFNPLFLYGGVGLGKTHLMHAVAWHVRRQACERKVIYLSAEKFMYQFIRALRFKSTMDFKEQFRSVDLLMIDDVQFISGKESTQEEFFHTFNALVDQNRQIVISADKSPSDLEGLQERMRSRLGWGLVADLHPTTYELRLGILQSKAEQAGVRIPQKVMEFLAHKITSNVRELEGALNRIIADMQLIGREVTLETTQDLLRDLLRSCERRVTIDEIQKRVAEHFNIRLSEMTSPRRARAVARPRQVAMYLAKQLTTRSLPEIGRKFGGRDHTTVMHAVRKIEELKVSDRALAEDVELLRRMLQM
ncbi:MAG: chromosomal replication initiator protein DnaA [Alphaproteobacteria bacterium]|nr:chromosomal replication initiator protein DnaA [Alphaproteobacteria bacterium]